MTELRRSLATGIAALLAGSVITLGSANPAQAATPTCGIRHGFEGTLVSDWDIISPATYYMPGYYYRNYDEYTWYCALRYGNTGDGVRALQRSLNECSGTIIGTALSVDGQFGTKTKEALIKVQKYYNITADGNYGPQSAQTIGHMAWNHRFEHWNCARWRA